MCRAISGTSSTKTPVVTSSNDWYLREVTNDGAQLCVQLQSHADGTQEVRSNCSVARKGDAWASSPRGRSGPREKSEVGGTHEVRSNCSVAPRKGGRVGVFAASANEKKRKGETLK